MTSRVAVLASGGGSNLGALFAFLDRSGSASRAVEVALVASDKVSCGALDRARVRGVEAASFDPRDGGVALETLLDRHGIDLVVLAGYLRMIPAAVTRRFHGRLLNVHPALLPAFGGPGMYGARVHEAVLAAGARVSGVTVHFVDDQYDHGAIIAQWPVPVLRDDTAATLAARVLRVEHLVYPRAITLVAEGIIRLGESGRVEGPPPRAGDAALYTLTMGEDQLARDLDAEFAR